MSKPRTWFIIDDADLSASYMYLEGSIEVVSLADYEALKADRYRLLTALEKYATNDFDAQVTNEALEYCMQNKSKAIDSIAKLEARLRLAVIALETCADESHGEGCMLHQYIKSKCNCGVSVAKHALAAIGPLDS